MIELKVLNVNLSHELDVQNQYKINGGMAEQIAIQNIGDDGRISTISFVSFGENASNFNTKQIIARPGTSASFNFNPHEAIAVNILGDVTII